MTTRRHGEPTTRRPGDTAAGAPHPVMPGMGRRPAGDGNVAVRHGVLRTPHDRHKGKWISRHIRDARRPHGMVTRVRSLDSPDGHDLHNDAS